MSEIDADRRYIKAVMRSLGVPRDVIEASEGEINRAVVNAAQRRWERCYGSKRSAP